MSPTDIVLVFTTVPDDDRAEAFARTLVDERLAACVNLHGPMRSVYRWKGQVESDAERQVVIKTTRGQVAGIEARLRTLHPYELPELLVMAVDSGGEAYLRWVAESVTSG
jgi:periplasmic divalent cation tolerance protein